MYKTELHHRVRKKTETKTFFSRSLILYLTASVADFLFILLLLLFKGDIREITLGGGPGVL